MKRVFAILVAVVLTLSTNAQRGELSRFERMFTTEADWGVAEEVQEGDVVFNELMPFVSEGRSKFVELYNRSARIIDLKTLMIANWSEEGEYSKVKLLSDTTLLLMPGQYVVLAPDTNNIMCAAGRNSEALYLHNSLPLFSSTTTSLVILSQDSMVVDKIKYSLDWHSEAIEDRHDVSLERIDPNGVTQDSMNWHSAASTVGYQTAGWENSQRIAVAAGSEERFWLVDGNTFSPNNDGYQDVLKVGYNLPAEGFVISMRVYTRSGALVRTVYENWVVNRDGVLMYDGEGIETGLYVMRVEAFRSSGEKYGKNLVFIKAK